MDFLYNYYENIQLIELVLILNTIGRIFIYDYPFFPDEFADFFPPV